jgi:hypothetical protein
MYYYRLSDPLDVRDLTDQMAVWAATGNPKQAEWAEQPAPPSDYAVWTAGATWYEQTIDEQASYKAFRANQTQDTIIQQWKSAYQEFYGLQPDGGSRYAPQQMQQLIAAMPVSTCRLIMSVSAAFVAFVDSAKPGALEDKWKSPAFEMTDDGITIEVGELKAAWNSQPEAVTDGDTIN